MDSETKEMLSKLLNEIEQLKIKVDEINDNQLKIAEVEHENSHMLADKLGQYDMILYKLFGKKDK